MRKLSPAMILSVLLALSWMGFLVGAPRAAQPEAGSQQKWEYTEAGSDLASLGREGWEAYAALVKPRNGTIVHFLKRPLAK
jgi:hypothetical protein